MNKEEDTFQPPSRKDDEGIHKILWLCAAFIPSVIGVALSRNSRTMQWPFGTGFARGENELLLALGVICSVAASIGLARGRKTAESRVRLGFVLSLFFFGLNAVIVLFIGCTITQWGR